MMADALYRWPVAAKFSSRVPKEKFYAHPQVTSPVRESFVREVARITWAYKLAESTINLRGNPEIPEVQVLEIVAKHGDVSDQVLAAVDSAIPYPIIFEVTRSPGRDEVRLAATPKRHAFDTPKITRYFRTEWQPAESQRHPIPAAIDLPTLYAALLAPITGIRVRPDEKLADIFDRIKAVDTLERDISILERKLRAEKQFNRKVVLRRALNEKQAQLEKQR
jgi:hypothetical protein